MYFSEVYFTKVVGMLWEIAFLFYQMLMIGNSAKHSSAIIKLGKGNLFKIVSNIIL